MGNTSRARFQKCVAFAEYLPGYSTFVSVIHLLWRHSLMVGFSRFILAVDSLSVPSFPFVNLPQVFSGLLVTLGGVLWRLGTDTRASMGLP